MATSTNYQMQVEDSEFHCPLCLEIFDEPKSFPTCAHSLCKACLVMLAAKKEVKEIACPLCRQTSPLPSQGVDGFPTNTLIVRLMEKIPGMKEKKEISQTVSQCKHELEKNKKIFENTKKKLDLVQRNKQLAVELKEKISNHAKEYIEAIKTCEMKMCKDVDELLEDACGTQLQQELEQGCEDLSSYLEVAQTCVRNVEEMISQDDLSEIAALKEVIEEQLQEYLRYPTSFIVRKAGNIKPLDIEFEKSEMNDKCEILGKILSKHPKAPLTSPLRCESPPLHIPQLGSFTDESDEDLYNGSKVLLSVDLSFCPSKIAVCDMNVALLCQERLKVYLYQGVTLTGVIQVKYGYLMDVGLMSSEVVVVNRENNRLLFYDTNGTFLGKRFQNPPQNVKFTYISVTDNMITVVSTAHESDDDDDEIKNCVVVYDFSGTISKIFGRNQLEHPVSRAIFDSKSSKFYVADLINDGQEVVVKTFSPHTIMTEINVADGVCYSNPFVSLFLDKEIDDDPELQPSSMLMVGYPTNDFLCVIDDSGDNISHTFTRPAQQQECLSCGVPGMNEDSDTRNVNQVEIYPLEKLFQVVQYNRPASTGWF